MASRLVGKKVKVRVERVLDGTVYASLVDRVAAPAAPITAEGLAEKPTRASRAQKPTAAAEVPAASVEVGEAEAAEAEPEPGTAEEETEAAEEVAAEAEPEGEGGDRPKRKRTRRGSRGGRRHRKTPAAAAADGEVSAAQDGEQPGAGPRIHLPDVSLGEPELTEQSANGGESTPRRRSRSRRRPAQAAAAEIGQSGNGASAEAEPPAAEEPVADGEPKRKRTRRGSRGGRRHRKTPASVAADGGESQPEE